MMRVDDICYGASNIFPRMYSQRQQQAPKWYMYQDGMRPFASVNIKYEFWRKKFFFLSIAQLQLGQGLAGYLHQIGTGLNWASHKLNFWIETPEMEDLFVLQNCAKLFCFPNLVCSPESEPWKGLSLFHWIWLSARAHRGMCNIMLNNIINLFDFDKMI